MALAATPWSEFRPAPGQSGTPRHTFLGRLVWGCVAALVLGATYLAIDDPVDLRAAADRNAESLAHNLAMAIDQDLDARMAGLQLVARETRLHAETDLQAAYQAAQAFHASFGSPVVMVDADAQILFTTRQPLGAPRPSLSRAQGRSAITTALQTGQPAVGDLVFSKIAQQPIVALAVPVLRGGKTAFVLAAPLEKQHFAQRLQTLSLPDGWTLALLDSHGDEIARRGPPPTVVAADEPGSNHFVVKSREAGWTMVLQIPPELYHAPVMEAGIRLFVVILGATLAALGGGILASRRLGRSMATLVQPPGARVEAQKITEISTVRSLLDEAAEQRRLAEDSLRLSEQRFRNYFELGLIGIAIVSIEKKCIEVNAQCCEILGYSREELLRLSLWDITHPDDIAPNMEKARQVAAGTLSNYTMERRWIRKDGGVVPTTISVQCVRRPDGSIDYFIAQMQDISARKRAEDDIRAANASLERRVAERTTELVGAREAADAANRAKSAFLANMSHEIRTPMNAITGLAYLMREGETTPQQKERLVKIETAAQHLLSILNDILDLSKIEADRLELEQTDFALGAILDNVQALVAQQAHVKGLSIQVEGDAALWLKGDPTRLRQAILNFAGNAVKFTERGTVWLRAKVIAETPAGLKMRFEVQDTGIGIPADKIAALFETFSQADTSTTRKYGGSGLGLAITRRLAGLMGGEAGVTSNAGRGSTFWFTAVLQRGQERRSAARRTLADAGRALRETRHGARLLLVEDNPVNREVAVEILKRVGMRVDTAETGRIAVEMVLANRYDLVLMDVQMPEMDGLEATTVIRAQPAFAQLPILAMTANAFDHDRRDCMAAGMNDFVGKPVVPQELYATLMRWLPDRLSTSAAPAELLAASRADAPSDAALLARLDRIDGVDRPRLLDNLGRDMALLFRLFDIFVQSHRDDMRRVRQALARGDMAEARLLAHRLVGASGAICAVRVTSLAMQLDEVLHTGTPAAQRDALVEACDAELERLAKSIARA